MSGAAYLRRSAAVGSDTHPGPPAGRPDRAGSTVSARGASSSEASRGAAPTDGGTSAPPAPADVASFLASRGMEMRHVLPPRPSTVADALVVFVVHMLPFTPVPVVLLALLAGLLYRWLGLLGPLSLATLLGCSLLLPPVYSPAVRARARFLYEAMAHYMRSVRVVAPSRPLPPLPFLFAFHPHGRMFFSCLMALQLNGAIRGSCCPHGDFLGFAASGFFFVPLLRSLFYLIGVQPADRANIVRCLQAGNHVALVVGGVREVCLPVDDSADVLVLLHRKGFLRVAMETGAGVIPMYSFTENQLFRPDPPWFLSFWLWVNRRFNMGVPFMRGVWHLPMPFRRDLFIVMGHPLFALPGESVDDFHQRYVASLQDLFYSFRHLSPTPHKRLLLV